jgi:6-phosphofructokinase 1
MAKKMRKIGVLTSGGDAPGMNAAIRSVVRTCAYYNVGCVGVYRGYDGLIEADFIELGPRSVNNIISKGGTMLQSARSTRFRTPEGRKIAYDNLQKNEIDGLVVIGGDGSFTGALVFNSEFDFPVMGIPGTIDNDIYGTSHTLGYDTALNTVIDAIDKIRDTASSHNRLFFVEVMGRNSGFLALNSAIASGAESVLIPETVTNIEELAIQIKTQNKGKRSSIIIVAEGDDAGGAMDIMRKVKPLLPEFNFRTTILGHTQRGGAPSYFDRALATRSGIYAVELLIEGKCNLMVGIKADELVLVPINEAIEKSAHPDLKKEELLKKLLTSKRLRR